MLVWNADVSLIRNLLSRGKKQDPLPLSYVDPSVVLASWHSPHEHACLKRVESLQQLFLESHLIVQCCTDRRGSLEERLATKIQPDWRTCQSHTQDIQLIDRPPARPISNLNAQPIDQTTDLVQHQVGSRANPASSYTRSNGAH